MILAYLFTFLKANTLFIRKKKKASQA